jgi:hypothetical protein
VFVDNFLKKALAASFTCEFISLYFSDVSSNVLLPGKITQRLMGSTVTDGRGIWKICKCFVDNNLWDFRKLKEEISCKIIANSFCGGFS